MSESTNHLVRVGVAVLIRDDAGRVLLLRRLCDPCAGTWCPPIGRVEYGEKITEAAAREVKEEVGLAGGTYRPLGYAETQDGGLQWVTHIFALTGYEGVAENREPDMHGEIMWLLEELITTVPLVPPVALWYGVKVAGGVTRVGEALRCG